MLAYGDVGAAERRWKVNHSKHAPCWLVVCLYLVVLAFVSLLILRFNLPDSLLFVFIVPCVLTAFFYGHRVYWAMSIALIAAAVWVTSLVSESFFTSLVTIAVAAVSMLAMIEAVRALVLARTRAQEILNQQHEESRLLSEMAMALLTCDRATLVFDWLGGFLSQVISDAIIIINQATPDQQCLITRQVLGLEDRLWPQVEALVGFNPVGKVSPLNPEFRERFFQVRLEKVPGGFSVLAASAIPAAVGKAAEALLGFHDVFAIGIAGSGVIWGNIHIITRRLDAVLPAHLIETVVYQCSSALSRIHALQELAASERKYRLLFQNLSTAFALHEIILDEAHQPRDYRLLEVNPAFETMTGVCASMLVGRTAREVLPEAESRWIEMYNRVIETGAPVHFEIFSAERQCWYQAVAYEPESGRLAVILEDITVRKQSETLLRESERRFHDLADNLPVMINAITPTAQFTFWNKACEAITGYSSEEIVGNPDALALMYPDSAYRAQLALEWVESGSVYRDKETTLTAKDGGVHYIVWSNLPPELTLTGNDSWAVGVDITARKQAEAALIRQQERLEELVQMRTAELQAQYAQLDAVLRSVSDALFVTDAAQRIRYVNPSFTTLTGYAADEVLDRELSVLEALLDFSPRLLSLMPTLSSVKPWQSEVRSRRKHGRDYDAALTAAPVRDEAGEIRGHVFTFHDISQAKDLERARSQFIANVSQQFRTPLTALKAHIYLLLRMGPEERQRQQLQAMDVSINWLTQLVQDTLEITALDSGKGAEIWAPVSLPDMVLDVLERYHDQAQAAGLHFEAMPFPPLPAVQGDAKRLAQAVGELVENAIAFTPAGGYVMIGLWSNAIEGEPWVAIEVRDTGPGIAAEDLPQLFEGFFRGCLTETGHTAGAGLGLSIAQKIAEAHGGHITVESVVGQGSTFTLWLRPALQVEGSDD